MMLKKAGKLFFLINSTILLLFSCSENNIEIIRTEGYLYFHPNSEIWVNHRKLSIDEGWVYKNNRLSETMYFDNEGVSRNKIDKSMVHNNIYNINIDNLKLFRQGQDIIFFGTKYSIIKQKKDSIITKSTNSDEDEYYIFIGNIQ